MPAFADRTPRRPCVRVPAETYAALVARAMELGVTNKALLEQLLEDLPAMPRAGPSP